VLAGKRRACASIELKHVNSKRRIYAYLRYSIDGRTVNRYVGEAHGATREEHLCEAWKAAHALRLLDPDALVEGSAPRGDAGAVAPRSAEGP